ncbi:translation initiation factor 2 subunit beta (aeIF-2b) [Staphylothermus marinus F1]|uniref:Translation initiation factor 2 subunit beta n=1 Tax=Staphylothermus marinus (strain ATCC 43588 / DSM 3639 / JCM 9404 / F1) TaxID=399550 RepID=IF2B_STAMF|nr:translation initiation factor IF-2 subunit beta [Staphylothermus marinus]A3DNI8.1 RecName: Full=Translation initiation factor 2 subunit beta; AltName: Full=aIF2-beta; AltName: Full=eIF-2-beta [Staphylothermus marinus F1]ABN70198.1 translation initiation factor 2 subunit beta (aeIF-2b) [Staphylothermus marinus F1]
MTRRIRDYKFEELLERAYSKLPARTVSKETFEVPRAEVMFVGGKTLILNFKQITDVINRDPKILQRYFVKELGVPAYMNESGQLILQGRFSSHVINRLIDLFVKKYVICPTCGSRFTKLIKKGKVFILKCEACGAETTLEAF